MPSSALTASRQRPPHPCRKALDKAATGPSIRTILTFWAPLALMWVLMSAEPALITAVIARLPEPDANLAAFQLTFSLALLVESPVIMLLTAATALASSRERYLTLLRFTAALAIGLTALHAIVGATPLFGAIVGNVIRAPSDLIEPARAAFLWMLVWSGAIAFRRLWQGVLIRHDETLRVAMTTVVRLIVTGTVCAVGLSTPFLPGASLGGLALSFGVIAGAAAAYVLARPTLGRLRPLGETGESRLSWRALLDFYVPLALTSFIVLGSGPIISYGLGNASDPRVALAIWPVVMGLLFVFRSSGYAYQEVVVALMDRPGTRDVLRRFALMLALALSGLFGVFVLTPLGSLWLTRVSGLSPELASAGLLPMALATPVPGLSVLVSWYRGRLVHVGATRAVTRAVAVNLATLTAILVAGTLFADLTISGAVLASAALSTSMAAETVALVVHARSAGA